MLQKCYTSLVSISALALSLAFLSEITLATPAIKPQSMRGIIFPNVNITDNCFVDAAQQVRGTCKNLAECGTALTRWKNENIRPQTCYFNKFEHIVCCEFEQSPIIVPILYTKPMEVKRRSEMECEGGNFFQITVVHGEPTAPNEFPYMAALGWKSYFDEVAIAYSCGGVLISSNFVLTAAHCAEMGGAPPIVVRIGGTNLSDASAIDIPIKRIIVHPGYNRSAAYNDIALVELTQESSAKPACVWSHYDTPHTNVTALGYGHTRFAGAGSSQLLKAPLQLVSNEFCSQFYAPDRKVLQQGLASTQICAGDPQNLRDTCQGDSGGPIIMKVERDQLLSFVVGITSFGQGCAGKPPSVYTRISAYIDWIEDTVWPIGQFSAFGSK